MGVEAECQPKGDKEEQKRGRRGRKGRRNEKEGVNLMGEGKRTGKFRNR